ncbi:MAG: hypothetical protein RDA78_25705 [Roseibium sp.]|uniref:hypothetical protein n=1 Tax=Roseibium sp. TaxID=1936156 RepID=UPI003D9C529F
MGPAKPFWQPGYTFLIDLPPFLRSFDSKSDHAFIEEGDEDLHEWAPSLSDLEEIKGKAEKGDFPALILRPISWLKGCKTTVMIQNTAESVVENVYARDINFDRVAATAGCRIAILFDDRDFDAIPSHEFEAVKRLGEQCKQSD